MKGFPLPPNCVLLVLEDTTFRLNFRNSLTDIESRYRRICESVQVIIWNADPATLQFTLVNKEAERILGYWIERWCGEINFWRRHLHPKDVDRVTASCARAAEDGKRHEFDHRMIASDGRVVWFHTSINLSLGPGLHRELTGVMVDVTARKRAERANRELSARVLRLRDEERRRISIELHDSLGQYLTALKINLAMLSGENVSSAKGRAMLTDTTELADSCIEEVRTYSYLLHPPTLDLLGLPSALEWYVDGVSKRTGIQIELDIAPSQARMPRELELPFFRVAQEALTNIVRHSKSRTAVIRFRQNSDDVVLEIADQGVGMPLQLLKRTTSPSKNGITGIGLLGMRERMRELGGRLEIQSSPNGTLIRASVPHPPPPGESRPSQKPREGSPANGGTLYPVSGSKDEAQGWATNRQSKAGT